MENLDARSDVYSLGVVMYELLAGRLPYELTDLSVLEAGRVIQEEEPFRISRIDTTYRGDVETILEKALAKEKERRYPSAAALADDIRRHLEDRPITARPASALYRLRKAGKRNQVLIVTAMWMAVVGVGAGLWWRSSLRRTPPIPSVESSAKRLTASPPQLGGLLPWHALSPDGERLIHRDGPSRFVLQDIETGETRLLPLPDGRGRYAAEWLPEGNAFMSGEWLGKNPGPVDLWRVSIETGERQHLLDGTAKSASLSFDPTWKSSGLVRQTERGRTGSSRPGRARCSRLPSGVREGNESPI
jgi:hypothetical protein